MMSGSKSLSFAFALLASVAIAELPIMVSNPLYDCDYNTNADVKLQVVMMSGLKVACGMADGAKHTMNINDFKEEPTTSLVGDNVDESVFYTLYLAAVEDRLEGMSPIVR